MAIGERSVINIYYDSADLEHGILQIHPPMAVAKSNRSSSD
jgi:hypothetical protein